MATSLIPPRAAALLATVLAFTPPSAIAANLVEFSFGTGVGTATADFVAPHLSVTEVVGADRWGNAAPHTFVDLGGGNMAMQMLQAEGGYRYHFTLQADPGYEFQIDDAHFAFRAINTAGSSRNISVVPNSDPRVTWYDTAGGDTSVTDLGPGDFGWKSSNWNAFVLRQDLQTLYVQLSLRGNSGSTRTIFDRVLLGGSVRPVPEPATALLFGLGAAGLWMMRRREVVPD